MPPNNSHSKANDKSLPILSPKYAVHLGGSCGGVLAIRFGCTQCSSCNSAHFQCNGRFECRPRRRAVHITLTLLQDPKLHFPSTVLMLFRNSRCCPPPTWLSLAIPPRVATYSWHNLSRKKPAEFASNF